MSGITASDKVYDGSNSAEVNTDGLVLSNLVAGDDITVSVSGAFDDENVGTGKAVHLTSLYGGADFANYSFTSQAETNADVTVKTVRVFGLNAENKTPDGSNVVVMSGTARLQDGARAANDNRFITGDDLSLVGTPIGRFADLTAAANKPVTVTGLSLAGGDAGNYLLDLSGYQANLLDRPTDYRVTLTSVPRLPPDTVVRSTWVGVEPEPRVTSGPVLQTAGDPLSPLASPAPLSISSPDYDRISSSDTPILISSDEESPIAGINIPQSPPAIVPGNPFEMPIGRYLRVDSLPPDHNVTISQPSGEPVEWVHFDREKQAFVGAFPEGDIPTIRVVVMGPNYDGAAFSIAFIDPSQVTQEMLTNRVRIPLSNQSTASATQLTGANAPMPPIDTTAPSGVTQSVDFRNAAQSTVQIPGFLSVQSLRPPVFKSGDRFTYQVPSGTFVHENSSEPLKFRATLADGSPLPSWIVFNAETQTFSGEAPNGEEEELDVIITATDSASQEAQVQLKINIGS